MTPHLLPPIGLLVAGLWLLYAVERREAGYLRAALTLMAQEAETTDGADQGVLTILRRVRSVLATTKAGRFLSLAFLAAGALRLAQVLFVVFGGMELLASIGPFTTAVALTIVLMLVLVLVERLSGRGSEREPLDDPSDSVPHRWIAEPRREPPPVYPLVRLLWEALLHLTRMIFRFLPTEAPPAQALERQNRLRLAIGAREVSAVTGSETQDGSELTRRVERSMIRAISRLDRLRVRSIMRPLNKVEAVHLGEDTIEDVLRVAKRTGYSRFPVYRDHIANLSGYINIYDIIDQDKPPASLEAIVREAPLVPEVAAVDTTLEHFLKRKTQVAICFDEFGAISGWLTREDILEEIVGEVADEYDRALPEKTRRTNGHFIVDGDIDLERLAEETGLRIEKASFDTIAGFCYARLGRIPKRGEELEEQLWTLTIRDMNAHAIRSVELAPPPGEDTTPDAVPGGE